MPHCRACDAQHESLGVLCPACGAGYTVRLGAEPHRDEGPTTLLGTLLGNRFAVVDVLGVGATGIVYEAIQQPVGRRCAVKVLRAELLRDADAQRRFEREATAASRLNHPNLVTLYDFAVHDQRAYLAMECVDGTPLSRLAPYSDLPLEVVVHILRQLLRGIAAAHELGIVHRDLKPDNVILAHRRDDPWFVKILDFGLARLANVEDHDEERDAQTGAVFGTPLYMSPEQVLGEASLSAAVDLYAWGAIAFELLSGRPPFVGKTPLIVMNRHVTAPIPALLPRAGLERAAVLESLVTRCLAKRPQERPVSANEVIEDLDQRVGLGVRRGPKAPQIDDDNLVVDSDLIELAAINGPLSAKALSSSATGSSWLHRPPTGSPRWSIPGRDEPRDALDTDEVDVDEAPRPAAAATPVEPPLGPFTFPRKNTGS